MTDKVFDAAFDELMKSEGGYTSNHKDPGGETYLGVTRNNHPYCKFWKHINIIIGQLGDYPTEQKAMLGYNAKVNKYMQENCPEARDEGAMVFKVSYWDRCRCNEMPAALAVCVSDSAYNSGIKRAIEWLQKAVGAGVDGLIGPQTLSMANRCDKAAAIEKYSEARIEFLKKSKDKNGKLLWPVFGRGWTTRVKNVEDLARKYI